MFEAHYTLESGDPAADFAADASLPRTLYSQVYHCPLHVWAVRGKRRDLTGTPHPHWFVYIEYCRTDGNHGCQTLEQPCSQGLEALLEGIARQKLPMIDPQRTREWLSSSDQPEETQAA